MTDPLSTPTDSPRHQLPLLAPGQAQKELFLNAALLRVDAMLHPVVAGTLTAPPATAADGENWIIGMNAEGEWLGRGGEIASRQVATWQFHVPFDGMRVYDTDAGQFLVYRGGWQRALIPDTPIGGGVVDQESRDAILQLFKALKESGIFPSN